MPEVSVVIPTHDRRDRLAAVLDALEAQRGAPAFEVVVVDDGSTDGSAAWLDARAFAVPARVVHQENAGPARARNRGVQEARAPRVAFLGDDTVPRPDWLARLWGALEASPGEGWRAVIGHTRWHPRVPRTAFLEYAGTRGLQFGFDLIEDPEDVSFEFLYTSNVILDRAALLAEPFDESFPDAMWEDTELSYRLQRRGLRMRYEPRALVEHDHPMDFASFRVRQERAGYSAVILRDLHPELGEWLGLGERGPPAPRGRLLQWLLEAVAEALEPLPVHLPWIWFPALQDHYNRGARRAWSERRGAGVSERGVSPRRPPPPGGPPP